MSKRLGYSQNYLRIFLAKNLSKKDKSLAKKRPIFDSYKMFFKTRTSISAKKQTILALFLTFDQSFRRSKKLRYYMYLEATCQHTHTNS